MKLHTLVLEGDKETEKKARATHPPVRTKSEYLRRKRRENLLPLFNRSFYLCRMMEEELKGVDIDGSGKITICAHRVFARPGEEKYIRDPSLSISIYHLEQEQIDAVEKAVDQGGGSAVIAGILRDSLLDIAWRSGASGAVAEKIERAFEHISSNRFVREERIPRLSKRDKDTGLTANLYRVLSEETGEGWYLEITDKKGGVLRRETVGSQTGYVDRLGSRLYAKAEWRENTFVITERFGKVVFCIAI